METTTKSTGLAPLKISCTSSDCDADLHCFKTTRKLAKEKRSGACRSCGLDLIDWSRLHDRSLDDVAFTFSQLRRERIRHHFWHLAFDEKALNHATRKGRRALNEAARQRIETSVARAGMAFDGRQTPRSGNTLYYAQHATACCCRRCIEYWHAIPADRDLDADEVRYLTSLVISYLDERLPDLADEPAYVPPRRSRST
jgi:Domain of unknown function (DUF4186)